MIIYEASVLDFLERVKSPILLATLATEIRGNLKTKFGVWISDGEMRSWKASLPQVAKLISSSDKDFRKILCEFNIPISKKRVDFIILGSDKHGKPSAWIVELKQWSNVTEEAWNSFRVGKYLDSHPSFQAYDYEWRLNHMMGLENKVNIKSSAFLHNLKSKHSPLYSASYYDMLEKATLYNESNKDELAREIDNHTVIRKSDEAFAFFKEANWSPTKKFQELAESDFNSIDLIGSQLIIYKSIKNFIRNWDKKEKMTFLISGNPGSGKTVIAFKIALFFINTLMLQIQLMIPGQELRDKYKDIFKDKNLVSIISGARTQKGITAAIIDEGHKAIARDVGKINYKRNYKELQFAIVFIDDDQVINKKGVTSDEVKEIAIASGHTIKEFEIEENFRNRGERALIDWIDYVFYNKKVRSGEFEYYQKKYINENFEYKLYGYENVDNFICKYYELFANNEEETRIVSLWHEQFYIGDADENGDIPLTIRIGNYKFAWNPNGEWWSRLSNKNKKTYSLEIKKYVEKRRSFLGEKKKDNIKAEYIAYFNHIQGYEFDNIFVYIPNIFTYENNEIVFHRNRLAKEVLSSQTWNENSKSKIFLSKNKSAYELNKIYFLNRIKVMLTRGTKSTHVFAEDMALNNYILNHIVQK